MSRYTYISHGRISGSSRTDLDAVASLAIFWRGAKLRGLKRGSDYDLSMVDYYANGLEELRQFSHTEIYLADVPPDAVAKIERPQTIARFEKLLVDLKPKNVVIHFIDHHPLSPGTRERFNGYVARGLLGSVTLASHSLDEDQHVPAHRKRCATEMVRDYLREHWHFQPDDVIRKIARFAHDQDFALRKIPEATALSVVIGADYPSLKLAEMLADGRFWSDELAAVHARQEEKTRRLLAQLSYANRRWHLQSGRIINVVYALMPEEDGLKVTVAGLHCIDERSADVAVLVHRDPFISLRLNLKEREINAGKLLAPLGGGGHPGAASAGGHWGALPYTYANRDNFEAVVSSINTTLLRLAGARSA